MDLLRSISFPARIDLLARFYDDDYSVVTDYHFSIPIFSASLVWCCRLVRKQNQKDSHLQNPLNQSAWLYVTLEQCVLYQTYQHAIRHGSQPYGTSRKQVFSDSDAKAVIADNLWDFQNLVLVIS